MKGDEKQNKILNKIGNLPKKRGRKNMNHTIIRKPELFSRVGLSDATIWRMERAGKFPRRVRLGGKSVGWLDEEIEGWFAERLNNRVQLAGGSSR